jgi:hypothetical protein
MALVVLCVDRREQLCGKHGDEQADRLEANKVNAPYHN